MYAKAAEDYIGFWSDLAHSEIDWRVPFTVPLDDSAAPNYRWFADGRLNVSYNCLDVHLVDTARQAGDHFRGRTRRRAQALVPGAAHRGLQARERAEIPRNPQRRPRDHLYAADPRGGDRDAGVCAHRRRAFGRVRRLLGQRRQGSNRGRGREDGDHGRRRLARRQPRRAQARGRQGARGRVSDRAERDLLRAHRRRLRDAAGPRPLVARRARGTERPVRAGMGRRGGSALSALYLGVDRQAEGHTTLRAPAICSPRS